MEISGLLKREWNELMDVFDIKEKLIQILIIKKEI